MGGLSPWRPLTLSSIMKSIPPLVRKRHPLAKLLPGDDLGDEQLVVAAEIAGADQAAVEVCERIGQDWHAAGRRPVIYAGEGIIAGFEAGVVLHQRLVIVGQDRQRELFPRANQLGDGPAFGD